MSTTQVTFKDPATSYKLFSEKTGNTDYLWRNLKIETRSPKNFIYNMYKGSFLNALWLMIKSPVS
jgi:hypothetical protein